MVEPTNLIVSEKSQSKKYIVLFIKNAKTGNTSYIRSWNCAGNYNCLELNVRRYVHLIIVLNFILTIFYKVERIGCMFIFLKAFLRLKFHNGK